MSAPPPISPQTPAAPRQHDKDLSDLRLLSILYYVMSALNLIAGLLYILIFGALIFAGAKQDWNDPDIVFLAIMMGVACVLVIAAIALHFMVARSLSQRRRFTFCIVIAVLACLNIPVGTILGVYTLAVLLRPSVKALFEQAQPA